MRDAHRGGAGDLAAVGDQHDLARVFDDGARYFDLAHVEIQQGSAGIDRGSADDRDVHAKLLDLPDGDGADDPAVALPNRPAGDDDFYRFVAVKFVGDVEVVGDDEQPGMAGQRLRHFLGGGAYVDQK